MTNVDQAPELIQFAMHDILPTSEERAVIVLKERNGLRYLPIRVGQREREMIESARRTPGTRTRGDERTVVVTGLTDGTFRSHLLSRVEGAVVSTPTRTTDVLVMAIQNALPIFVAPDVARFACVTPHYPEITRNGVFYPAWPNEPIAAITYPRIPAHRRARGRRILRTLSVVAFVLAVIAGVLFLEEPRSIQIPAEAFFLFTCGFSLVGIFGTERLQGTTKMSTLLIAPIGLKNQVIGAVGPKAGWSQFRCAGLIEGRLGLGREGLIFAKPIPLKIGPVVIFRVFGFPLSQVDPNWRTGEIGKLIRLFAPHLVGVTPVDPDGGAVAY